uniref:Corticotropin releasing hormone n=1 Tax=Chelydra serpentina TaxID=8475 RepID=A0A8C3SA60_CHESE
MKLQLLVSTGILLVALLPCHECRALTKSPAAAAASAPLPPGFPQPPPSLLPREAMEREKRSEEPPISLDLTFHLLREVLEMARAEQLAQQAHSNRKLMEIIGK